MKARKGAAWFETETGFVKNRSYERDAGIRLVCPTRFPELGLTDRPLYTEGIEDPSQFRWLVRLDVRGALCAIREAVERVIRAPLRHPRWHSRLAAGSLRIPRGSGSCFSVSWSGSRRRSLALM